MRKWNPTWSPHHLPRPITKRMRLAAIARDEWRPGFSCAQDCICWPLFDHWGSAILEGDTERSLIAQPYVEMDREAREFAAQHGFLLTMRCRAPWHPKATFYAFSIPPSPSNQ